MDEKIIESNFQIEEIGLKYIGHFNICEFVLYADCFSLTLPVSRMRDFIALFPDINWEDGYMLHKLKGRYLRCLENGKGKVVGLKHIVKNIVFMI